MSNLEPLVQFGPWCYRATVGKVWLAAKDETSAVLLEPRLQKLLNYFLLHPNQLLSKNQLIADVWPAGEGTDGAVMRAVGALRKILGDNTQAPSFINTIPKKGYCWLATVTPLTSDQAGLTVALDDASAPREPEAQGFRQEWLQHKRFLSLAVLSLVLSCGIIAYGLTHLTLSSVQPTYTRIQPVSALNGREQSPLVSDYHQMLWYQHQPAGQQQWHWVRQSLDQVSVQHATSYFSAMGSGVMVDNHMLFSAEQAGHCGIYLQRMIPVMQAERQIGSCRLWLRNGLAWHQSQLYWLDRTDKHGYFQLWQSPVQFDSEQLRAEPVLETPLRALQIFRVLVWQEHLYVLAQVSFFQTDLIRIRLDSNKWDVKQSFPYVVTELASDNEQLWVGLPQQPFTGLAGKKVSRQTLGSLSTGLRDVQFVDDGIVAVEGADTVSDLWAFQLQQAHQPALTQRRWFASNRSERIAAVQEHQVAFVSERSGSGQIWLAQREQLRQLTELRADQQVQQLLWYRQQLLVLINQQLYQVDATTGALQSFLPMDIRPSRVEVCRQQLYWTENTESGWKLFTMAADRVKSVLANVVDFRCAPDGFVVRTSMDSTPALWSYDGMMPLQLASFTLALTDSVKWLSNDRGIAWLDTESSLVRMQFWDGQQQQIPLSQEQQAIGLFSDKSGQFWLVQQARQQDSDIVRLLPERRR
ncbi:winged helix-turn-helix domain-containing protein [Alkalimonas collagenimarina]|uniref:Winged helix-turn-helix domain-containing protein n=1 Tax=Alkalimonas collagenimarina TaxID=400390 RepID=A0ABT9GZW4_9GAMM|nr:winged helix-turn-helix domain-containing protein [Alkalimonas collagenimarina]MDP4536230.1 winged helix-turn-helix domain-containing protein [Alkalimonas collagenimarina]